MRRLTRPVISFHVTFDTKHTVLLLKRSPPLARAFCLYLRFGTSFLEGSGCGNGCCDLAVLSTNRLTNPQGPEVAFRNDVDAWYTRDQIGRNEL